ncbi:hypothetical protein BJV74DRAFT_795580 [Russula compacta]|nr:hypothetical protein BJV74DRAFT_795580 [Russula compacta]
MDLRSSRLAQVVIALAHKRGKDGPLYLTAQALSSPCMKGSQRNNAGGKTELLKGDTDQILVFILSDKWCPLNLSHNVVWVNNLWILSLLPITQPVSSFFPPLFKVPMIIYTATLYAIFIILRLVTSFIPATWIDFYRLRGHLDNWPTPRPIHNAETEELWPKIYGNVLDQTFSVLREDHDLERFFEGILGFCDSKIVGDPQHSLDLLGRKRLEETLEGFLGRTLSSHLVPEAVKGRRIAIAICMKVVNAAGLSFQAIEIGHSLRKFGIGNLTPLARCMISAIISNVRERDDRWVIWTSLGSHYTFFRQFPNSRWEAPFHELQHDFCALWNEVVQQARNGSRVNDNSFVEVLVKIRHLYIALHRTDVTPTYVFASAADHDDILRLPDSYPLSSMADYRPNLTSHIPEALDGTTGGASHIPATTCSDPLQPDDGTTDSAMAATILGSDAATSMATPDAHNEVQDLDPSIQIEPTLDLSGFLATAQSCQTSRRGRLDRAFPRRLKKYYHSR